MNKIQASDILCVEALCFDIQPKYANGYQGFLLKQGRHIKTWRKRYFILNDKLELYYYTDNNCKHYKGSYVLTRGTIITKFLNTIDNHKFILILQTMNKNNSKTDVLYLSASSELDRCQWYNAIIESINGVAIRIPEIWLTAFYPIGRLEISWASWSYYENEDSIDSIPQPSVNDGNILKPKQLIEPPYVSYMIYHRYHIHHTSSSTNTSINTDTTNVIVHNNEKYHSLIMLDIDFPSRRNINRRYYLQWLLVDIKGNDIQSGREIISYQCPCPSYQTGLHRYFILLYEQPCKYYCNNTGDGGNNTRNNSCRGNSAGNINNNSGNNAGNNNSDYDSIGKSAGDISNNSCNNDGNTNSYSSNSAGVSNNYSGNNNSGNSYTGNTYSDNNSGEDPTTVNHYPSILESYKATTLQRSEFQLLTFCSKMSLTSPVSLNGFFCEWDEYCIQLQTKYNITESYNITDNILLNNNDIISNDDIFISNNDIIIDTRSHYDKYYYNQDDDDNKYK